ncbi:MAG: TIGR03013 family XrtA/PEP-CTERM system glycosyltransferase [Gammaproteobacteria bacterium]
MATVRLFRHYIPAGFLALGAVEALVFAGSVVAGIALRFGGVLSNAEHSVGPVLPKALTYALVMILSMTALGLYQRGSMHDRSGMALRVTAAFMLGFVPLSIVYYVAPSLFLGRGVLALGSAVALIGILVTRVVFMSATDQANFKRRVLVLGTGQKAGLIRQLRKAGDVHGAVIVGYVRMGAEPSAVDPQDNVIELDRPLAQYVREQHINEMVVAVDDRRKALPVHDMLDCKMNGVDVVDLLTFFEKETGKVKLDILQPSWMFLSDGFQRGVLRSATKRLFDVLASLVLLPLAFPVMGLVAVAVFWESGGRGPIFFRQVRSGENGVPFEIIKFRSMCIDAEKDGVARWAQRNDSRITRVGGVIRKARLDELPQLFNVLRGEMSFVGPRPERPEFVQQLGHALPYYHERHRVKPGLTGWAQICYQYGSSEEDAFEKLQYDLYYVKNYSIFLDLLILLQTAEVILLGKGAH